MPARCPRSRRRPTRVPQVLRGPRDALEVIVVAATDPNCAQTICLLLDHAHRGLSVVILEGAEPDHDLVGLGDVLLGAVGNTVGAVVLATVRPGRSHLPDADDERRWFDLRVRFEEAGVELLDWFVLCDGMASSLCELTDSRWRWLDDR